MSSVIQNRSGLISFRVSEEEGRVFIVASVKTPVDAREAASLLYTQIAEVLSERGMVCVHERIFGRLSVEHDVISARRQAFASFGISPENPVTYIEGNSPSGAVCAMDLMAVLNSEKCTRKLSNPSQLDAFRYGSAFARASVVNNGSTALIEVSGTAAIDEHGVSLYPGDIRAQIHCTFDKVAALLKQEDAELKDICSATVFVKRPEFAEIFYEMAAARGLENFPCVCIVADVCREELLFEIDAEAVVKTGGKG